MPRFRRFARRSRRRGRGRRSFRRFANRIARAGTEPKKLELAEVNVGAIQGDGTTPVVNIRNLPSNLIQGDTESNFHGNSIWLKGVGIRASFSANDPTNNFSTYYVRYTLLFSRTNATGMLAGGADYDSTTTDNVGPVQASPFSNPRLFDINATPGRFTGTGYATLLDRTNIKVLSTKLIVVNNGGAGEGMKVRKMYFRINKPFQYQNPDNSALTVAPNHGRYGSYYLIRQVFTPAGVAGPGSALEYGSIDEVVSIYFRDP